MAGHHPDDQELFFKHGQPKFNSIAWAIAEIPTLPERILRGCDIPHKRL